MHISEGVLSPAVLVAGGVLTAAGVAYGIKKLKQEDVPRAAVITSAFFVATLIHVPIGFASVHLVLNGLLGIFLEWAAFPCVLVAILLQALLFQFGGLTTLGVNTFNMAFPAVVVSILFRKMVAGGNGRVAAVGGFLAGALAVFGGASLVGLSLILSGESFRSAAVLTVSAHVPVMIVDGIITAFAVLFMKKVKPEILEGGTS